MRGRVAQGGHRMRTRLCAGTLFAAQVWAAGIIAYPGSIQLTGLGPTQGLAFSAGEKVFTANATFDLPIGAIGKIRKNVLSSASAKGKSNLTIRWKNERMLSR